MAFRYNPAMADDYLRNGFIVFEGAIPPALVRDLRRECDKARQLAFEISGPRAQRLQPVSRYGDKLNHQPFHDYAALPELQRAFEGLVGPDIRWGALELLGILVEPREPWSIGWHRDGVVVVPAEEYETGPKQALAEIWHSPRGWNQINAPIYAESNTWFVPGSHLRQWDLPGETMSSHPKTEGMAAEEIEAYYRDLMQSFPGAVQVHMGAGDLMIYRNLAWHTGNYLPYQRRATLHDGVFNAEWDEWYTKRWAPTKRAAHERAEAKRTAKAVA